MLILTNRHLELIIQYTNPIDSFNEQLEIANELPSKKGHEFKVDNYCIDMLLADLVHYSKKIDDEYLLEEIDDLYSVLERSKKQKI